jgi:glutamate/tyrosine decarboxylase-like PLP-dependent enzyme
VTRHLEDSSLRALADALHELDRAFAHLPTSPSGAPTQAPAADDPRISEILQELAHRLADNYPYFHPLYAGQMLKPPHPVARAAYALAMWLNPNNHALDGGRATSRLELEAVAELARMVGLPQHLGHLTGGGTMANLEALWVASRIHPGKRILASSQAHYTHSRISSVLGLDFATVPTASDGRLDLAALERILEAEKGSAGTVVATLGTTATGAVDQLDQLLLLRDRYGFRLHADAAYGGYFTLASTLSPAARAAFDALPEADSIVIDPHKHGLQPYGCGCILFRDPTVGRYYKHDSPNTYLTSAELHLGEISLECSRPGAAAAALWATQCLLPLTPGGDFARALDSSLAAARSLHSRLAADPRFLTPAAPPQLDIAFWTLRALTPAESSARARTVFGAAAVRDLHLALAELPADLFPADAWPSPPPPGTTVTCLRSVLMKPEHRTWLDEIWSRLSAATAI